MKLLSLMCVVLLAACAGTPSRQVVQAQRAEQTLQQDLAYCEGLMADPALDAIRRKTPIDNAALIVSPSKRSPLVSPVSYEMIADRSEVSDGERAMIAYWNERDGVCVARLHASEARLGRPALAGHRTATAQAESALRAPLVSGEWNWGQYNVARRSLLAEARRVESEIRLALQTGDAAGALRTQQQAQVDLDGYLNRQRMALAQLGPVLQRGSSADHH